MMILVVLGAELMCGAAAVLTLLIAWRAEEKLLLSDAGPAAEPREEEPVVLEEGRLIPLGDAGARTREAELTHAA